MGIRLTGPRATAKRVADMRRYKVETITMRQEGLLAWRLSEMGIRTRVSQLEWLEYNVGIQVGRLAELTVGQWAVVRDTLGL